MPDVFTKSKRSEVMSRIRSRGNKDSEVALVKLFRLHKITGWRRHFQLRVTSKSRTSPRPSPQRGEQVRVRPDFVFLKLKFALFVDGCFWHCCPQHGTQPKGNRAFWKNKFAVNIARDLLVTKTLRRSGWRLLRIWEHDLHRATKQRAAKKPQNEASLIRRIQRALI
jgi:DNA mismatch endonuclease (patch repair protein)